MKSTITITIDSDVADRLRRLDLNKSALINDYLKYYVERHTGKIEKEEKTDPILEKKINMMKKELEITHFTIPPYYVIDKPDLLDIYLWDKSKEFAARFELKTDQALRVLENYLNAQKETSSQAIQNSNVKNSTSK
ncbi:MAG: type II toxin-antitoxin system CcdA family antitoxin [Conexivisphaerales archaeon]